MKQTKRIVILGAGESGTGAALLANWLGYDVLVSDKNPIKPTFKAALDAQGIAWEEGQHSMDKILAAGEIIKSPGIPEKADVMQAIRAKGIPVIGEIEFGWRHRPKGCRIVAITGSNGKTTTTTLTAHLLDVAGLPVRMAGNVGNSFAQLVLDDLQHDVQTGVPAQRIYVLEVSSFQLDDIDQFRANIAVLLNITPDHLDRYDYQLESYTRSKFRVNRNQKRGDVFLFNGFDPVIREYLDRNALAPAKKMAVRRGFYKNGVIRVGRTYAFEMAQSKLHGPHNIFNAACALRVALLLNADPKRLRDGLLTYTPPAHRLEPVATIQGVNWINDVSGCRDIEMQKIIADSACDVVMMHSLSVPADKSIVLRDDENPVDIIMSWASSQIDELERRGIARQRIIFDPGVGFGKTPEQSLKLLAEAHRFRELGVRVLIGHSRKSFLSLFTEKSFSDRDPETLIASLELARKGVDYLRVHNVAAHTQSFKLARALRTFT